MRVSMEDRRTAWLLGLAGLLPFLLTLGLAGWGPGGWQETAVRAFLCYSAVILSFLGGTHWGAALQNPQPGHSSRLLIAMAPSLIAWPALLFSPLWGLVVLGVGFMFVWGYDLSRNGRFGWPSWYWQLRTLLTVIVVLAHVVLLTRLW
ncbi:hypothetical protein ADS46_07260 [Halomonas sp. G11]|nr:hypothetical protein ADS46_07260 [Halomonas sp. G11]